MTTPRVSIALVGESFYLCGPLGNNVNGAASSGFQDIFGNGHSHIHHTYVALGVNGSYFIRYFDSEHNETRTAYALSAYPGLQSYFNHNVSDPVCVALGENDHYFVLNKDGSSTWRLPQAIEDHIEPENEDNPVEYLVLGKDDAYYARLRDGSRRWDFRGNYGSLIREISHLRSSDLLGMGMNLQDDRSYAVITRHGVRFNTGRAQLTGLGLTPQIFNRWAERFRS